MRRLTQSKSLKTTELKSLKQTLNPTPLKAINPNQRSKTSQPNLQETQKTAACPCFPAGTQVFADFKASMCNAIIFQYGVCSLLLVGVTT